VNSLGFSASEGSFLVHAPVTRYVLGSVINVEVVIPQKTNERDIELPGHAHG
jgi:hypothetical protein